MGYEQQESVTSNLVNQLNDTKKRLAANEEMQVALLRRIEFLTKQLELELDRLLCALDTLQKFSSEARPGGFNNAQACIDRIKEIK